MTNRNTLAKILPTKRFFKSRMQFTTSSIALYVKVLIYGIAFKLQVIRHEL